MANHLSDEPFKKRYHPISKYPAMDIPIWDRVVLLQDPAISFSSF
jgi:hypothetical protein